MIVREEDSSYVCIEQHEHARLAGWLAVLWGNETFSPTPEPRQALILATTLHDIGWRRLDENPLWDKVSDEPFPFTREPIDRKIPQYMAGVDLVEREDPYAALLCSRHYTSFFPPEVAEIQGGQALQFVDAEEKRQVRLRATLQKVGRDEELRREDFDLGMLKLWDHLSLYIALNRPGIDKAAEHPFYKDGFPPTYLDQEAFNQQDLDRQVQFSAQWVDHKKVALTPYPLRSVAPYALSYRKVSRLAIERTGFPDAYHQARPASQVFSFVPAG